LDRISIFLILVAYDNIFSLLKRKQFNKSLFFYKVLTARTPQKLFLFDKLGFENDIESGVLCRYKVKGVIVDVMPTDASVIGFTNRWYADGFKFAKTIQLDELPVKIFTLPFFIASKIEAFKSRGQNNYLFSSDFEDIVYILENNSNIASVILESPKDVRQYLKQCFTNFLQDVEFEEGISAHLEPITQAQQIEKIFRVLREII
jgi:hypothetical protein